MQTIVLGEWGTLTVFGPTEAGSEAPSLPEWLPAGDRYRVARLTLRILPRGPLECIAVWPDDHIAPDPGDSVSWAMEQLDGMILAQPQEHFQCAACGGRVNALYPEAGLPIFNQFIRHRWATHCPRCGAHVDAARLHALALFAPRQQDGS